MGGTRRSPFRVIIPAFNEERALTSVVEEWLAVLAATVPDAELHLYDDGSTDRTPEIAAELARSEHRVTAHRHPNRGHGPTVLSAYRQHADAEWLFQCDADGEVGADEFPRLWEDRDDYDLVLGHRLDRPQGWRRRLFTRGARGCVRLLCGRSFRDTNVPFRLIRVSAFRRAFEEMPASVFAPNVLLTLYAGRRGLPVREVPVKHRDQAEAEPAGPARFGVKRAMECARDTATFGRRIASRRWIRS